MSNWRYIHITPAGFSTDITSWVKPDETSFSITGNPVGQSLQLRLYNDGSWEPTIGARIGVIDETPETVFTGWVSAISRNDLGDVAGIAPAWTLIVEDIYAKLRNAYFPMAEERVNGKTWETEDLERPAGLRDDDKPVDPGTLNMTPAQMFGFVLDTIAVAEGNKNAAARIPDIWSVTRSLIANPTTQIPKAGGGYEDFKFKYCPIVLDGISYYDALDNTAILSGLLWRIRPDLTIETWDATSPPTADYEIRDGTGGVKQVVGSTWIQARTIDLTQDTSRIANRVTATYVDEDAGQAKPVTREDTTSQNLYGVREKRIPTDGTTAATADAVARRTLATSKDPNIRGTVRIPYAPGYLPGRWVWIHRTKHTSGASYYKTKAYLANVSFAWELGRDAPTWIDLEFSRDPQERPGFRAFVPRKDSGTTDPTDTTNDGKGKTKKKVKTPTLAGGGIAVFPLRVHRFYTDSTNQSSQGSVVAAWPNRNLLSNDGIFTPFFPNPQDGMRFTPPGIGVDGGNNIAAYSPTWNGAGQALRPVVVYAVTPWTSDPGINDINLYVPCAASMTGALRAASVIVRALTTQPSTLASPYSLVTWRRSGKPSYDSTSKRAETFAYEALAGNGKNIYLSGLSWTTAVVDIPKAYKQSSGKIAAYASVVPGYTTASPTALQWAYVTVGQDFQNDSTAYISPFYADGTYPSAAHVPIVDPTDGRYVYVGSTRKRLAGNLNVFDKTTWSGYGFALFRVKAGTTLPTGTPPSASTTPSSRDARVETIKYPGYDTLEVPAVRKSVEVYFKAASASKATKGVLHKDYEVQLDTANNTVTAIQIKKKPVAKTVIKAYYEAA